MPQEAQAGGGGVNFSFLIPSLVARLGWVVNVAP